MLRSYRRFVVVIWQFLPLAWAWARDRKRFLVVGGSRDVAPEVRRERATRLRESLETLGPTFVKLGQLLSTRPDVAPPAYVAELARLQDRVPPADWTAARTVLEDELGPVEERFEAFDDEPISGASLGQVYRAHVDGDEVAVKVRRPGVESLVAADLRVIQWLLPLLTYLVDDARSYSLETLADEFETTIGDEMDYEREARMLREIRANFADDDGVAMPAVVNSHSTRAVLTMEYVPGTKISNLDELDAMGVDRTALAERLQRTYLQMIIDDGVFQADPHPGNLAVQPDGTLVLYDFGMSDRVDPYVQDRIVDFYAAVAEQDVDAILDALIEMGTLSPEADRQLMGEVMELAIADARGEDLEQYRVQQIVAQVEDTMYEFPLKLPPNLALVLRAATVVEGVCVTLDSDFDFITVATAYLREEGYVAQGRREFVEERVTEVREAGAAAVRTPPKFEAVLDRIEREDLHVRADLEDSDALFDRLAKRLVGALVLAALVFSTAYLYVETTPVEALVPFALAVAVAAGLAWSFRRRRAVGASPQFTRQSMRERQDREESAQFPVGLPDGESGSSADEEAPGSPDVGSDGDGREGGREGERNDGNR